MAPLPASRQEARAVVYRYYQATLRELPDGFALDSSRYGDTGETVTSCNDNAPPNTAPAQYSDDRVVVAPPDTNYGALIAKVGDIWRGWGWRVIERDGFDKPNRFGYAPDGYWLSIESAPPGFPGYPPTFGGASPCFGGDGTRYISTPTPRIITKDGPQPVPAK